jgi:hypothetical protein
MAADAQAQDVLDHPCLLRDAKHGPAGIVAYLGLRGSTAVMITNCTAPGVGL